MCGKPNPADAEICQHCGSRLKPITSLDDLFDSVSESPQEADKSEADDLFDAMRAQFDEEESAPSTEPPSRSLPDLEMDFSFGSSDSDDSAALPSFLTNRQQEESFKETGETPDWLSELEPPDEAPSIDVDDALGWLSSPEAQEEEPIQPPADAGATPDWLSEFDSQTQAGTSPEPTGSPADLPGWLSELADESAEKSTPEKTEPETGDLGWLSDYAADDEPDTLIVDLSASEEEAPATSVAESRDNEEGPPSKGPDKEPRPSAVDDAVPDWLADLATDEEPLEEVSEVRPLDESTPPPLPGGTLPSPIVEGATPSWLMQQRADEAAEEAAARAAEASEPERLPEPPAEASEPSPAEAEEEPVPEWLAGVVDKEEEPVPDWMAGLDEQEQEEPSAEPAPETAEVPGWMADLSAESEPQAEAPEPVPESVPAVEIDEQDSSLDWLEESEADSEVEEEEEDWFAALDFSDEPVAPVGDDLLGLSSDFIELDEEPVEDTEPAKEEEVARAVDFGDLPEWLQGMGEMAGMAIPDAERPLAPSADVSAEELAEVQSLRYEALTGQDRTQRQEQAESVGALKDVRGVIQPELIFEGSTLTVSEPVQQVIVTPTQAQQVEQVQRLLQRETETFAASESGFRLPVVRWLVAILMLLAVAGSLLGSVFFLPAPEPAPSVISAHQAIDGMTALDAVVLVAFEYEPDSAGEMDPLAEALLWHLAQKSNVTVYTISTRPAGPAMADAILARGGIQPRLAANGGTWQNLGYVSGQANGVSSLAGGDVFDVSSPFSFDNAGRATGLAATSLSTASVDNLIVLAARPEDARMWIEQASQPTGIPLIAAVGASAAPLLRPYANSGQIAGLLVGLNDAVAYWRLGDQQVGRSLLSRYNAQAVGSLVATALILIGGIVYGLLSLRNRKEGLS